MGNGILKSDEEWQKEKSPICCHNFTEPQIHSGLIPALWAASPSSCWCCSLARPGRACEQGNGHWSAGSAVPFSQWESLSLLQRSKHLPNPKMLWAASVYTLLRCHCGSDYFKRVTRYGKYQRPSLKYFKHLTLITENVNHDNSISSLLSSGLTPLFKSNIAYLTILTIDV